MNKSQIANQVVEMRVKIADIIRQSRKKQELSQQALADLVGIRKATLVDLESARPSETNTILAVLIALNLTIKIK